MSPRLEPALKRHRAVDVVRRAILDGTLQPGERLVELRLARELGVSQTPVREALSSLEREGLVVKLDHRGTYVARVDAAELNEIATLRALLEGECARRAAAPAAAGAGTELREHLSAMRAAAERHDLRGLIDADMAFHETLRELAGHRLLAEALGRLHDRTRLALAVADGWYADALTEVAESHVPLLEALEQGDADAAERHAREHVLAVLGLIAAASGDATTIGEA